LEEWAGHGWRLDVKARRQFLDLGNLSYGQGFLVPLAVIRIEANPRAGQYVQDQVGKKVRSDTNAPSLALFLRALNRYHD